MTSEFESKVVELVTMDRIYMPFSSADNKLKKLRPKLAIGIYESPEFQDANLDFVGERTYARAETKSKQVARGMKEGIDAFSAEYPQYGQILKGMIEQKREASETHLYFGMNESSRIASRDYMKVMIDLGFTPGKAESLYPELMQVSRKLSKARNDAERSCLVKKLG